MKSFNENISYQSFIEDNFLIKNKDGVVVPFRFDIFQEGQVRSVQDYYMVDLYKHYGKELEGIRDIVLKGRKEGFCVDPNTRILTSDLLWKKVKDINIGQEIISVDENIFKAKSRKMCTARVEYKRIIQEEAFLLKMDNGEQLIATGQHRFLSQLRAKKGGHGTIWRQVRKIIIGDKIRFITKPWGVPTLEDAWFSGILDGEGSIHDNKSGGVRIVVSQAIGSVWDRIVKYARLSGFSYREEYDKRKYYRYGGSTQRRKILGRVTFNRMNELFALIGKTRPTRFIGKYWWENRELPGKRSGIAYAKVISIQPLGIRKMVDLQTTSKTFIAEGFVSHNSAMVLGIFATDFLMSEHPIGCVSIADTKEETQRLLSRAKFFIESAALHENRKLTDICDIVSKNQLRNKWNGAEFWIGTAGSKVALRTETVQDLHFSEAAHFADTDIITATETIEGALQMVPQGKGKVFIESTANGYGNYYQELWDKASLGESTFRPVFYGADQFYSKEWLAIKETEFTTREMFWQEYPNSPGQAFISSGSKFFDTEAIMYLQNEVVRKPLIEGQLNYLGELV